MSDILFGSPPFPEPLQVLLPHLKYPFLICLQVPTPYSRPSTRTASAGETSQIPQPDGAGPLSPTYCSDIHVFLLKIFKKYIFFIDTCVFSKESVVP